MEVGDPSSWLPDKIRNRPITAELVSLQAHVGTFTRQASYALFALLVWDMLLTLKDEVQLIWPARFTVIKVLFLINRYIAPAMIALGFTTASGYLDNLTDSFCQRWLLTNIGAEQLFLLLVSFVMVFRLHAAWDASRTVLILLMSLWLAGVVTTGFTWVHVLYAQREWIWAVAFFNVCFPEVPRLWRLFVPNVCLHFVLLAILVTKAIATPRTKNTAMLIILLRDGIAFYSVTLCVTFTSVLIWALLPEVWKGFPIYTTWSITTMATSRFLLSLKYSQSVRQTWIDHSSLPLTTQPSSTTRPQGPESLGGGGDDHDRKSRGLSADSGTLVDSHFLSLPLSTMGSKTGPETALARAPSVPMSVSSRGLGRWQHPPARIGGWRWWLLGRRAVPENNVVVVDVSYTEWWDEWEDRGPGLKQTQVGRYDWWL